MSECVSAWTAFQFFLTPVSQSQYPFIMQILSRSMSMLMSIYSFSGLFRMGKCTKRNQYIYLYMWEWEKRKNAVYKWWDFILTLETHAACSSYICSFVHIERKGVIVINIIARWLRVNIHYKQKCRYRHMSTHNESQWMYNEMIILSSF